MPKPKLATGQVYPHMVQNPDTGEVEIIYKPYAQGEFASDEEYAAAREREQGILVAGASETAPGGFAPPSKAKIEAIVGPIGSATNPAGPTLEEQMAAGRLVKDEQPVAAAPTAVADEEDELTSLINQLQSVGAADSAQSLSIFSALNFESRGLGSELVSYSKSLEQLFSTTGVALSSLDYLPQPTDPEVISAIGEMPTPEIVLQELRTKEQVGQGKKGAPTRYTDEWAYTTGPSGLTVDATGTVVVGAGGGRQMSQEFKSIYDQRLKVWNDSYGKLAAQAVDNYRGQLTSVGGAASSRINTQIELYKLQEQLLDQQIQSAWYRGQLEDAATARVQQRQIEALRGRLTKRGQDIDLQVAEMGDRLERWKTGWDAVKFFSANPSAYFVAQQLAGGMPLLTAWGAPDFRKLATKFFQDTAILSAQQLAQMSPTERQFYLAGKGMQGLSPEDLAALTERLTPKQPKGQKKVTRERA